MYGCGGRKEADIFWEGRKPGRFPRPTITHGQYLKLTGYLKRRENPALLPIQIAYYTGLRIGEVCGLTWQDVNLDEQYLTVCRSMRYNGARHKTEIGTTKRRKVRTVDFATRWRKSWGGEGGAAQKPFPDRGLYHLNYYTVVKEKDRTYYEVYSLPGTEQAPEGYKGNIPCLRQAGRDV